MINTTWRARVRTGDPRRGAGDGGVGRGPAVDQREVRSHASGHGPAAPRELPPGARCLGLDAVGRRWLPRRRRQHRRVGSRPLDQRDRGLPLLRRWHRWPDRQVLQLERGWDHAQQRLRHRTDRRPGQAPNFDSRGGAAWNPTGIGTDDYAVEWEGEIVFPVAGAYQLTFTGDDGFRVFCGMPRRERAETGSTIPLSRSGTTTRLPPGPPTPTTSLPAPRSRSRSSTTSARGPRSPFSAG